MADLQTPTDDFRRLAVSMKPEDWALAMKLKAVAEAGAGRPVSLAEVVRMALRCLDEHGPA